MSKDTDLLNLINSRLNMADVKRKKIRALKIRAKVELAAEQGRQEQKEQEDMRHFLLDTINSE